MLNYYPFCCVNDFADMSFRSLLWSVLSIFDSSSGVILSDTKLLMSLYSKSCSSIFSRTAYAGVDDTF